MADPFQKVGQNDPLVFRADWFNFVTDAAKWVRSRQAGQGSAALLANDLLVPATLAYVKNTTGSSILAFSPVALSGDTLINPTDKPINARRQPVFTIAAPTGPDDLVFITMEPIADQKIGRAATLGVTVAQINVNDASHQFAQPIAGNTTTLESAESGPIRILGPFVEGTGTRLVLLGGVSGSSSGDCTGCGWIVGLDETSCLTIEDLDDVTTGDLPNLTNNPSGSDDWLSTDVITIYGTDYYLAVYLPDEFHSPLRAALLTPDGSGGATIFEDGFLDCCGSGYATFAFNKKALIENRGDDGDPDEVVDTCAGVMRFKVSCGCDPITEPCCPDDPTPAVLYATIYPPSDPSYTVVLVRDSHLAGFWSGNIPAGAAHPASDGADSDGTNYFINLFCATFSGGGWLVEADETGYGGLGYLGNSSSPIAGTCSPFLVDTHDGGPSETGFHAIVSETPP